MQQELAVGFLIRRQSKVMPHKYLLNGDYNYRPLLFLFVFKTCVHDLAWWWVKASNLEGLGGPVVRFHLAHVICFSSFLINLSNINHSTYKKNYDGVILLAQGYA